MQTWSGRGHATTSLGLQRNMQMPPEHVALLGQVLGSISSQKFEQYPPGAAKHTAGPVTLRQSPSSEQLPATGEAAAKQAGVCSQSASSQSANPSPSLSFESPHAVSCVQTGAGGAQLSETTPPTHTNEPTSKQESPPQETSPPKLVAKSSSMLPSQSSSTPSQVVSSAAQADTSQKPVPTLQVLVPVQSASVVQTGTQAPGAPTASKHDSPESHAPPAPHGSRQRPDKHSDVPGHEPGLPSHISEQ